jgi:hypothetical protein
VRTADVGYLHILLNLLAEHVELKLNISHIHASIGLWGKMEHIIFNENADTMLVANISVYILGKTIIQ